MSASAQPALSAVSSGAPSSTLTKCSLSVTIKGNKKASVCALATLSGKVVPLSNQIVPYNGDSRQPQKFAFGEQDINIEYDADGNPIFYGPDVCRVLELSNASRAYDRLDDDEKVNLTGSNVEHTGSGRAPVWVNESGLYSLIMQSRKPAAKVFKKWITSEVLPTIRKSGSYSLQVLTPAEMILVQAQQLVAHERQIAELREQTAQNTIQIEDMNAKLLDRDFMSIETWCKVQGIKEGLRSAAVRIKLGKDAAALSRANSIEIKHAPDEAHTPNRYHVTVLRAVCVPRPRTNGQLSLLGGGQ